MLPGRDTLPLSNATGTRSGRTDHTRVTASRAACLLGSSHALARGSPLQAVRISELVHTANLYRQLQAGLTDRTLAAAKQASQSGDDALAESMGLTATDEASDAGSDPQQDSVQLSGDYGSADLESTDDGSQDDSLGAIVESFLRQRQTYQFTIPGVKGVTSPINVTWEVERAYRVIEFVPRSQMIDQEA